MADLPDITVNASKYGTRRANVAGYNIEVSADPEIEAKAKAAFKRLAADERSPYDPRLSASEYGQATSAAGLKKVMNSRRAAQNTDTANK